MTWAQSLAANYTDGILILHRGRIVYERYFGALTADRQHLAFSVTKSFVATVAATLIAEGALDERATVASYLPELRDERRWRCHHSPAARHDHRPRLHGGLRRSEVAGVGALAGRRLPRASAGLSRPRVVLRLPEDAQEGETARREVRLQDGEHRRARPRCCGGSPASR